MNSSSSTWHVRNVVAQVVKFLETQALYFHKIVECVFLLNYYVKDNHSVIKYCSSETILSYSQQLAFFPKRV